METRMINKEEIEMIEHAKLGKRILNEIEKMKRGEYPGDHVIMPVRLSDGGIARLSLELPTKATSCLCWDKDLKPFTRWEYYAWSQKMQDYVLINSQETKEEV